jgi:hypothetical protein
MDIPKNIKDEIIDYCQLNNISYIDDFILKMIKQGLTIEKYGSAPSTKEKIIEKIIEKEVEKIIEVPVEKIVEKIIEKEILVTNDDSLLELTNRISELELELSTKGETIISEYDLKLKEKDDKISLLTNLLEVEKRKKRDIYGE